MNDRHPLRLQIRVSLGATSRESSNLFGLRPTTTIATIRSIIIDALGAPLRRTRERVLRSATSGLVLRFWGRELDNEKTLAESEIIEGSTIEATGVDAVCGRALTGELERAIGDAKERAQQEVETGKLHQEAMEKAEKAEKTEDMLQKEVEEDIEEMQAENARMIPDDDDDRQSEMGEEYHAEGFQIAPQNENLELVENEWEEDPFDEKDADKESWDPQILRELEAEGAHLAR